MLAIEFSTAQGSVAVLEDGDLLAQINWTESRTLNRQQFFRHLPDVLSQAGVSARDIDVYVTGRGPGAYTGLRMASAVATAMALPAAKPAYGACGGAALAAEWLARPDAPPAIAVVGDARRDHLWVGVFTAETISSLPDWQLVSRADFSKHLPAQTHILSSDWPRLQEWAPSTGLHWQPEPVYPTAAQLGCYAAARLAHHLPLSPPTPIYMHPAVAAS